MSKLCVCYTFAGAGTCVFSLLCALSLAFFDKRNDRILKRKVKTSG